MILFRQSMNSVFCSVILQNLKSNRCMYSNLTYSTSALPPHTEHLQNWLSPNGVCYMLFMDVLSRKTLVCLLWYIRWWDIIKDFKPCKASLLAEWKKNHLSPAWRTDFVQNSCTVHWFCCSFPSKNLKSKWLLQSPKLFPTWDKYHIPTTLQAVALKYVEITDELSFYLTLKTRP